MTPKMLKKIFVGLSAISVVVLTGLITGRHHVTLEIFQTLGNLHRNSNADHAVDDHNQTWDVIVSTYMRSGSTFLGRKLGHRSGSFYWYEPLWRNFSWKFHREDGKLCDYLKPTCGNNTAFARNALDSALHFLSDIYKCRLAPHANRVQEKLHSSSRFAGPSWQTYRTCRKSKTSSPSKCLPKLEPVCRNATHRVTKVLRMDFSYIEKLLDDNSRLKAILLLRDPRGILSSHIYSDWFPMNRRNSEALEKDAKVLCSRMERDIKAAKSLLSIYPTRVKIVQYEDVDSPVKLRLLYSFLNMDADRLPLHFVMINASAANSSSDKSRDLFAYRAKLDWRTVQVLDSHCKNVYRELGLVQYKDENHLRNLARSPIINALPYSLETRSATSV